MSGAKSPFSIHPHDVRWDTYTNELQFSRELSIRDVSQNLQTSIFSANYMLINTLYVRYF
jgi:hypothetical protein